MLADHYQCGWLVYVMNMISIHTHWCMCRQPHYCRIGLPANYHHQLQQTWQHGFHLQWTGWCGPESVPRSALSLHQCRHQWRTKLTMLSVTDDVTKSAVSSALTAVAADRCAAEPRDTRNASIFWSRLSVRTRCWAETRPTPAVDQSWSHTEIEYSTTEWLRCCLLMGIMVILQVEVVFFHKHQDDIAV